MRVLLGLPESNRTLAGLIRALVDHSMGSVGDMGDPCLSLCRSGPSGRQWPLWDVPYCHVWRIDGEQACTGAPV